MIVVADGLNCGGGKGDGNGLCFEDMRIGIQTTRGGATSTTSWSGIPCSQLSGDDAVIKPRIRHHISPSDPGFRRANCPFFASKETRHARQEQQNLSIIRRDHATRGDSSRIQGIGDRSVAAGTLFEKQIVVVANDSGVGMVRTGTAVLQWRGGAD